MSAEENNDNTGNPTGKSIFDERTEVSSSAQYFHYYGQLAQQQNMLQDLVRTGTYRSAMIDNAQDFNDKIVLDVGSGTGMLSYFALQAGAKKVYAIEASHMAVGARTLAEGNGFGDRLIVIKGKVEEVDVPEQVDMIISEPMGTLLVNERMLESYVHARKWLKKGGNMFPSRGVMYAQPFQDDELHMECFSKTFFWTQHSFYGVDMRPLQEVAVKEAFATPIVDAFNPNTLLCRDTTPPSRYEIDFLTCSEEDLFEIKMPIHLKHDKPATIHGIAYWFDVIFDGSHKPTWLSTAPYSPLTHWYQVRCLFEQPLQVGIGEETEGEIVMNVNRRQSYDIQQRLKTRIAQKPETTGTYNLKDPLYRCAEYSSYDVNMVYDPNTGTATNITPVQPSEEEGLIEVADEDM